MCGWPQKPGGFTRWLTRVHLGSSTTREDEKQEKNISAGNSRYAHHKPESIVPSETKFKTNRYGTRKKTHTVYSFPIFFFLPVEDRILVFREHLFFSRHFLVPSLHRIAGQAPTALERSAHGIDYPVNCAKAFALSCLLRSGQTPGDFPVQECYLGFFCWLRLMRNIRAATYDANLPEEPSQEGLCGFEHLLQRATSLPEMVWWLGLFENWKNFVISCSLHLRDWVARAAYYIRLRSRQEHNGETLPPESHVMHINSS